MYSSNGLNQNAARISRTRIRAMGYTSLNISLVFTKYGQVFNLSVKETLNVKD
jgi:hypothetical protein